MDTARSVKTDIVDDRLRERRLDALLQIETRSGDPGYAFVITEHKSRPESSVLVQLLKYAAQLYSWAVLDRWAEQFVDATTLQQALA